MKFEKNHIIQAAGGEFAIYQRYLPGLTDDHLQGGKKNIQSCFSKDSNPSLNVYKGKGGKLLFKCFSTGKQGDVFQFFAENEGLDPGDFTAILQAMNEKFGLGLNAADRSPVRTDKWKADYQEFTEPALAYWNKFKVDAPTLDKYQVRQLSTLTYQGEKAPCKFDFQELGQMAFEYRVNGRFKLYVPKQEGLEQKYFIKTQTADDVFGLDQLPKNWKVPYLLICEGEKDALCANALGFPAVSFQSANTAVTAKQIRRLYDHACDLVICYDTDKPGIDASFKLSKEHSIPVLTLPTEHKDLSEYLPAASLIEFKASINDAILKYKISNRSLVKERNGRYMSMRKKKNSDEYVDVQISNFILVADAFIKGPNESKRIIRIKDAATGKLTEPFSVGTDQLTSVEQFRKLLESQGNYFFSGLIDDLIAIKQHCFKLADSAEEIPHLGHYEHDGKYFFALSNSVLVGDRWHTPDKFGLVMGLQIPSAALENKFNDSFSKDRTFRYLANEGITFDSWVEEMRNWYGHFPTLLGVSFVLSSFAFDHISSQRSCFPLLHLFGQKGSGKNTFTKHLLALFGPDLKHDLNLFNATANSMNKLHEQKANIPVWLDEFKNSLDTGIIERLKSLYDLVGRSKAIDSSSRTKSSQIKTCTIINGQEFPTDEALLSRCLLIEFQVHKDDAEKRQAFEEFKAKMRSGLGHLIPVLLVHRPAIIAEFQTEFIIISSQLGSRIESQVNSRIIDNYAMVLTPLVIAIRNGLKLFKNQGIWENERESLLNLFADGIRKQFQMESKIDEVMQFWECFINMASGMKKVIYTDVDFVIKDEKLGFKGKVLDEFQRYYRSINGKEGVNKDALVRYMASRNYYKGMGRMYFNGKQERCHICDLDLMPAEIKEDLIGLFSFAVNQSGHTPDATPKQDFSNKKPSTVQNWKAGTIEGIIQP
jgi:Toprim-like